MRTTPPPAVGTETGNSQVKVECMHFAALRAMTAVIILAAIVATRLPRRNCSRHGELDRCDIPRSHDNSQPTHVCGPGTTATAS